MDENTPLDQDQDFPSLVFNLEEDPHLISQLSHFGRDKSPAKDVKYRPSEQQLLKEGKLGSSEFTARLQQASFGTFKGETACLVVIKVDFAAKKRGWFRFRRATIEMEVEEPSLGLAKNDEGDEEVSSDDSDEAESTGPLIRAFYPDLIRGHIQTAAETYNISFELPIPSPVPSGGLSTGWTATSPRESHHLVHGFLVGSPETRVRWNMHENEISKGGLYEQPVFAIVVRYREEKGFVLELRMRATTYGGLGVVGKGGAKIKFVKTCKGCGDEDGERRMGQLTGSVTVGGKTWNGNADSQSGSMNLQEVDLELLTLAWIPPMMHVRSLPAWWAALSALLFSPTTSAFYLPGVAPTTYKAGDRVELNVNHLTPALSEKDSQLHSVFSFDYYHPAFRFCRPEPEPKDVSESLGSILFGDRILSSPFELKMMENETCKALCEEKTFDQRSAKFVNRRIWQNYNLNWLIDGLPAGQPYTDPSTDTDFTLRGFPLGMVDKDSKAVLNNHYDIVIDYHKAGADKYRVVGVLVIPSSREDSKNNCGDPEKHLILNEEGDTPVTWTYGVYWRESKTAWATRWDSYLHVFDPRIHWFSLVNSAVIVIFLCGMVGAILMRSLKKDFARYNRLESFNLDDLSGTNGDAEDGIQEDSGWKLVHGDVFRTPKNPLLLSVFLGNGSQLFVMVGTTITFALLGFLSPSNRGSLGTVMILLYTVFGFIGGYVSARVYKSFGGEKWKLNIALTPVMIPGIVFATFFLLNLFLWAKGSSGAVPFTTMLVILGIWFVISVPLSFAGSWAGFRRAPVQPPVRVNQIPRQIPPSATYLRPLPSMLLVGILPFGAIFVELYFIMNNMWFGKVYYMFGFLFLCYGIMIITCAAVTILLVYFLLCSENYHWQWRAFCTAGASAAYVFANALLYWISKLSFTSFTSGVLYVGYSLLISFLFFILTGTIGFFSSWAFVHRIYGSIKID